MGGNKLTMRDCFAADALTGLLANHKRYGNLIQTQKHVFTQDIAKDAYAIADAMLEERKINEPN